MRYCAEARAEITGRRPTSKAKSELPELSSRLNMVFFPLNCFLLRKRSDALRNGSLLPPKKKKIREAVKSLAVIRRRSPAGEIRWSPQAKSWITRYWLLLLPLQK